MKIAQKFNQLTLKEYFFYIDNYRKYTDFNTLGLYRSILENEKLTVDDKILLRDYAHQIFRKSFDFLQLKDPNTFFKVSYLGMELTEADKHQKWRDIVVNQQKILLDKKIRHRNFGDYSKHSCGYDSCPYNGLMVKKDSVLAEGSMHFLSDKDHYMAKRKSDIRKKERKNKQQIIDNELSSE
jgi:hypothetical protein